MPGYNVGPRKVAAPLPGGLFSVAEVVDAPDRILGNVDPDPVVCGEVLTATGWCFPVDDPPTDKEPIGFSDFSEEDGQGEGFFAYLALECYLNGGSLAPDAEAAFDRGEEIAVAKRVATLLGSLDTSGGAGIASEALALAEEVMRGASWGVAILGAPATISHLGGAVKHDSDWNLFTRLGTPLAAVPGLAADTLTVAGPITLYRGTKAAREVPNTSYNRSFVLVERPWAALVDCAAVSITITEEPL